MPQNMAIASISRETSKPSGIAIPDKARRTTLVKVMTDIAARNNPAAVSARDTQRSTSPSLLDTGRDASAGAAGPGPNSSERRGAAVGCFGLQLAQGLVRV